MKARYAIVLLLAVMIVSGGVLLAQGPPGPRIKATVPFAFGVSNDTMPAGHYDISYNAARDLLTIRSVDANAGVMTPTVSSGIDSGGRAQLMFYRYGDTYFLRQVWMPGNDGHKLLPSKVEKVYAKAWKQPESIVVAAAVNKE